MIAADATGPFDGYQDNETPFLRVMRKHRAAVAGPESKHRAHAGAAPSCSTRRATSWDEAIELGEEHGFRNGQATVLAPTGTIAFLMDCDTTGIEPDIALVKYKRLVGGGMLKIVNQTVPEALRKLGYDATARSRTSARYIDREDTIEGAPGLKDEHLPVFDCAFRSTKGTRSIHYMGHIRMMAAVQPFLSGAISKTVNLPNDCTVEDIEDAYIQAWKLGLKAIAVYRDGCKRTQPLSTSVEQATSTGDSARRAPPVVRAGGRRSTALGPLSRRGAPARRGRCARARRARPGRRRRAATSWPTSARSFTHKFSIGGHEGYITVGLYADGSPGEIFVRMAKEGSVIAGLMDSFATAISLALQHGVPMTHPVREVQGHALRALRLHRQPGDPDRDVDHGLPVPLALAPLPRRASSTRRRTAAAGAARPAEVPVLAERPKGPRQADRFRWSRARVARVDTRVGAGDRRAAVPRVRHADGAQRRLPQVPQLRLTTGCS